MKDERTCREVVIYRIESYVDGISFYDPTDKRAYDYDNMTNADLVRAFELLVFDYVRIRNRARADQDQADRYRR